MWRRMIPSVIFHIAIGLAVFALALTLAGRPTSAATASLSQATNPHIMGIYHGSQLRTAGTNLVYQGGAVETTPRVYISWWGSQWNTGFATGGYSSAKAQAYVKGFFGNVGGSSWDKINTQYCQGTAVGSTSCNSGSTHITNPTGQLAGTWVDTTSVPTSPTQSQIQNAATRLMNHFGGYNANATYFVFTPHGHSMSGFGWITSTGSSGQENGDLCAWASNSTDITLGAHFYAVQPLWSNASRSCVTSY